VPKFDRRERVALRHVCVCVHHTHTDTHSSTPTLTVPKGERAVSDEGAL